MKLILLIISFITPFHLIAQKVILNIYENENHIGSIGRDVSAILFSLEEGKKSPILNYDYVVTEDFELSEDSLILWACKFRAFNEAEFLSDTTLEFLSHRKSDANKTFGTFEKLYLEIRDDKSIEIKFSIKIIGYKGRIRNIFMTDTKLLKGITPEKVISLYNKAQATPKLKMSDLPPPPPFPGEEESKIRHQKAIEAFKCN